MKHKIFVVGSANTDMVVRSGHIPVPGETVLGGEFLMNPGGKGANQAVAAARLGGNVIFVARVGDDLFGRQDIEGYNKEGIDTRFISVDPVAPSGVALIMVDGKGENCISVAKSANDTLTPEHIKLVEPHFGSNDFLLMQLETPLETVTYTAAAARAKGMTVILNPAPGRSLPRELLVNVNIIIPNETEAELITGVHIDDEASARRAADFIADMGVGTVIITMGCKGVFVRQSGICDFIPAHKVVASDTTAAGDTFCGAFTVALSEGRTVAEAVRFGNSAAAISVTRVGAQSSVPTREELDRTYADSI